jgi:hypothetical protein
MSKTILLKKTTSGDQSDQTMTDKNGNAGSATGYPVGVFVDIGAGVTSVIVTIKDSIGATIFTATVTADTSYGVNSMSCNGCQGPMTVTTASIAGGTAVTTYLYVRE